MPGATSDPAGLAPHTAIVTGAASGLGRALAVRLGRDGWHLALCDVNETGNAETLALVERAGGRGHTERLDVSQLEEWQSLCRRLQDKWPHLDLLVNNAGVAGSGEVGTFSVENWNRLLDVNLRGGIYGCHACVEWLKQNPRHAHILNIASLAAVVTIPAMAAYNVSKAGLLAFSETLYGELLRHGVGVTVVCPSFFQTNLLAEAPLASPSQRRKAERFMRRAKFTADDVAEAALRAVRRRQLYVFYPAKARWYWRLKRWLPRTLTRLIAHAYNKSKPEKTY